MSIKALLPVILLFFIASCSKEVPENHPIPQNGAPVPSFLSKKFIFKDGNWFLWGGSDESMHFDINNLDLDRNNFKYGVGRENFKVLENPEYTNYQNVEQYYDSEEEFIIIHADEGTYAYALDLLKAIELVNETIDEEPVLIGYCVLADFVAVYSRRHCEKTLTFAVSGYTYWEEKIQDSRDGFILWDRDTESLWWPIIDRCVSGAMKEVKMNENVPFDWERKNWDYLIQNFPDAQILEPRQDPDPIIDYPRIDPADLNCPS